MPPCVQATGYTYGWYYAAMRAWEHYVPYMVKHENDLLDVSTRAGRGVGSRALQDQAATVLQLRRKYSHHLLCVASTCSYRTR